MPLSEEEQRILHEMEQKLYEHDRAFVNRVRAQGPQSMARRSARWSVLAFVVGLVILVVSFRSSLLLGTFGFLAMLLAALSFEHSARQVVGRRDRHGTGQPDQAASQAPGAPAGTPATSVGQRPARPGLRLASHLSELSARFRDRSKGRRDS